VLVFTARGQFNWGGVCETHTIETWNLLKDRGKTLNPCRRTFLLQTDLSQKPGKQDNTEDSLTGLLQLRVSYRGPNSEHPKMLMEFAPYVCALCP
jgi:hypothetical protein